MVVMLAFVSEPDGTIAVHSPLKFRVPVTWLNYTWMSQLIHVALETFHQFYHKLLF